MPDPLFDIEPGDLIVATDDDFACRRDLRTWEELPDDPDDPLLPFISVNVGLHGMFLGKKPTPGRPSGIAIYIPSEAAVIVGIPSKWKLLKRVKNKVRQNR